MNIVDISRPLLTTIEYPGDPETRLDTVLSIEKGDSCNLSAVYACVHTGTHADAPSHFLSEGDTIDKVDLNKYIGHCTVIEVPPGIITGEYVDKYFPKKCSRLLIKGDSQSFFMESAAYEALDTGMCLIGTDADSIGHGDGQLADRLIVGHTGKCARILGHGEGVLTHGVKAEFLEGEFAVGTVCHGLNGFALAVLHAGCRDADGCRRDRPRRRHVASCIRR